MLRSALAALLVLGMSEAVADDFPTQPVRVVVPSTAGGASDLAARVVLKAMEGEVRQPLVVVNIPGAGTALGSHEVAAAKPDGYTLLMMHEAMLSAAAQGRFKEGVQSLVPVAMTGSETYTVTVHRDSPHTSLKSLCEAAKAGTVKAAVNIGGFNHFTSIIVGEAAGVEFRAVQYSGGADALKAILGKHVDVIFIAPSESLAYVQSGELRVLTVLDDKRMPIFPDVPTAAEAGYPKALSTLNHMWWVPKGTSQGRIDYLADRLEKAITNPDVLAVFDKRVTAPTFMRGAKLQAHVDQAYARIKTMVDTLGLGK